MALIDHNIFPGPHIDRVMTLLLCNTNKVGVRLSRRQLSADLVSWMQLYGKGEGKEAADLQLVVKWQNHDCDLENRVSGESR
ncbi:hypothetical protein BBBOND_0307870 [Babesia bigemina]|uniref:Uncharacterized protein n=1 Tax=Babesia bigemina TaxID=5866 RepID=A0A061D8M9_BABBI|nr:hypothetical protein BBBOND_0307870 [Babesia bigemina]CDR96883.1 hypothetical protein BBBOND_0307870 [Babesia bigemina]|eukprot:XP_012769069.1 hypothetical protein BBBOND_0307870 [Babesia bigemina]